MTFEEYDAKMDEYADKLRKDYSDDLYQEVSEFQDKHMREFLAEYGNTVGDDLKKKVCYELLEYAIKDSTSGNAIVFDIDFITNEEEAKDLEDTIFEEIGQYLLDDCEVYQEDGSYLADVMFGGAYVPYWDGWNED